MTARYIVSDVFDGLATLDDGTVDLVVTSPPFLALRSYLPADHPDKAKEIGSEATPAEWLDVILRVTRELRRVLAPHGSICIELGDTYSGSSMSGGDDATNDRYPAGRSGATYGNGRTATKGAVDGWPLSKSKALIAELYRIGLAYGINPLTGQPSPAGRWRIRNVVTWVRPNPPVGALGDKWRPATSDLTIACTSAKRYWDDLATRKPATVVMGRNVPGNNTKGSDDLSFRFEERTDSNPAGAPLLDWWEIPPGGYKGSHYAVFPEELVIPCVQAMAPPKVCRTCGEPSRRIVGETAYESDRPRHMPTREMGREGFWDGAQGRFGTAVRDTLGWSDCGHDDWRPALILDPFAGSGTTLAVATGYGHDAIGIDLDPRNAELALDRVGPFLLEVMA